MKLLVQVPAGIKKTLQRQAAFAVPFRQFFLCGIFLLRRRCGSALTRQPLSCRYCISDTVVTTFPFSSALSHIFLCLIPYSKSFRPSKPVGRISLIRAQQGIILLIQTLQQFYYIWHSCKKQRKFSPITPLH